MKKWKVTDTITFERTYYIPAIDADKAIAIADSGALDPDEYDQVENTPWDAEEIIMTTKAYRVTQKREGLPDIVIAWFLWREDAEAHCQMMTADFQRIESVNIEETSE